MRTQKSPYLLVTVDELIPPSFNFAQKTFTAFDLVAGLILVLLLDTVEETLHLIKKAFFLAPWIVALSNTVDVSEPNEDEHKW
jgi:hypothetical protein